MATVHCVARQSLASRGIARNYSVYALITSEKKVKSEPVGMRKSRSQGGFNTNTTTGTQSCASLFWRIVSSSYRSSEKP